MSTPPWEDEPFEQFPPPTGQRASRQPPRRQTATPFYRVLVASPWVNEVNGRSGTSWTDVGVAFPLRDKDGFKLRIKAGLSITGDVLLLPPQDANATANGG